MLIFNLKKIKRFRHNEISKRYAQTNNNNCGLVENTGEILLLLTKLPTDVNNVLSYI